MEREPVSFLMERMPLEEIRRLMEQNDATVEELAEAVAAMEERGEPPDYTNTGNAAADVQPLDIISAPDLQRANLPPIKYIVEGILPDGTSLISAASNASQIGKIWMVLHLGLCSAAGEPFMGHTTNQCGILYLALEDSLNRLQNRMNKILNGKPRAAAVLFYNGGTQAGQRFAGHPDGSSETAPRHQTIIIDTLQKIRGQALPRESSYAQDYREMETVKGHMDKLGAADLLAEQQAREEYESSPIVRTIRKLLEQSPERRWDGTAKDLMEAGKYIAKTYLAADNQKPGYDIRDLEKPLFDYDRIVHSTAKTNGAGGKKHHFWYQGMEEFEEQPEDGQEKIQHELLQNLPLLRGAS